MASVNCSISAQVEIEVGWENAPALQKMKVHKIETMSFFIIIPLYLFLCNYHILRNFSSKIQKIFGIFIK